MIISEKLNKYGVTAFVAGAEKNFRYQTMGDAIVEEVQEVLDQMHLVPNEIYSGQQVHGKQVAYCDGVNGDPFVFGKTFDATDGLLTNQVGIALMTKTADCTPIVIFDPIHKALANLHSGWRSTVQQIAKVAVTEMQTKFGSKPKDLIVFVGPSIDQANYQVGKEVYEAFEAFPDRDDFFIEDGDRYKLSMTDANLNLLKALGIKEENIEVNRQSTFTDPSLHSARQEGVHYGLNGIFAMIRE